jgi:hypothetical protein
MKVIRLFENRQSTQLRKRSIKHVCQGTRSKETTDGLIKND